jgi:hypothetical protein
MMEVFPLLGIGNVFQTSGLISASILGAQERSGKSMMVQLMGN